MARNQATQVENNFTLGLITEKTALSFPENAATDTDNCIFNQKGDITRRLGLAQELGGTSTGSAVNDQFNYSSFLWESAAGVGTKSFLVVQQGLFLIFYDVSSSNVVSSGLHPFSVNLTTFLPANSFRDPGAHLCDFAAGNGDLIVVNAVCDPFYITYDPITDSFTTTKFSIKYRDFDGVPDEFADSVRPAATVATLFAGSPNHSYNLYNQGWGQSDALTQWDVALASLPSNQDQVAMFRASETDAFDPAKITSKSPGNTLAPRGHFILDAANPQRAAAMTAEGVVGLGIISSDGQAQIDRTLGLAFTFGSKINTRLANAYDSVTSQAIAACATNSVASTTVTIGRSYIGTPKIFSRVVVHASSDQGINNGAGLSVGFQVYGKNGVAPATETDGTLLTSGNFLDTVAGINNFSFNNSTAYEYIWVRYNDVGAVARSWYIAEIKFYESADTQNRFSSTAFLAGRAFFAGVESATDSNKVYFSQIVNNKNQYGRCYQKNDPTNEYYFELLSDDGGVIKILEMGEIVRLFPLRSSMVVFASNGIWLIGGSGGIKATDFTVKKLSSLGTTSPKSIVDVKGIPVWWAEDGIYTMVYDANYDSFQVQSLTQTTIKKFFLDIPVANRQHVKGTYDQLNEIIYWIYNDSSVFSSLDHYKFNRVLCLNTISKAFYPWSFPTGSELDLHYVRDIKYIASADRLSPGKIKLYTSTPVSAFVENTYFSEFYTTDYLDWGTYDYTSYFTTGYKIHGQTQRYTQPNYVFVFLDTETDSSCFMHTRFDWTNDGSSGKWSNVQQVYNPALTFRDVNFRRLKVRGKGRSMQMHYVSETGKPFNIIGWSVYETGNSSV